jgi:hypothetical protein
MDRRRIIAIWLLYRRYRKYRKNRIHWVHPINEKREEVRLFYTLFQDLRKDEKKFLNFRMSISTFDYLHERLKDNLRQMFAIALR